MKFYPTTGQIGQDVSVFVRDGLASAHAHNFDSNFGDPAFNLSTRYPGQVVHPEQTSVVNDPILGAARKVLRVDAQETVNPDGKVRVQMVERFWHMAGEDFWVGFAVMFPVGFPTLPADGWFMFNELHGPPFDGASPNAWYLHADDNIGFGGGGGDYFITPMQRGAWIDIAIHFRLSRSALHGFAEVSMNKGAGWAQMTPRANTPPPQMFPVGKQARYATVWTSNRDGFLGSMLKHYRKAGMGWGTVTQYYAEHRIGESFADVAPHSYT